MDCIFSSSLNQSTFFCFLTNEFFFGGIFFSTLTLIIHSLLVTLLTLLSYWHSYPTYLHLGPTYQLTTAPSYLLTYPIFFHWLNFYLVGKSFYLFFAKPLFFWQNLFFLAKHLRLLYLLTKLLSFLG
jgi:hypothetical protein